MELLLKYKELPRFEDGRINFHNAKEAPVIIVFVKYKNKFLLLKRSNKVHTYKNTWNTIGGYYDEPVPFIDKVSEELREELNVHKFKLLKSLEPFEVYDKNIDTNWILHLFLIELFDDNVKIDFEHTEYVWVSLEEIKNYKTVPNLYDNLKKLL